MSMRGQNMMVISGQINALSDKFLILDAHNQKGHMRYILTNKRGLTLYIDSIMI